METENPKLNNCKKVENHSKAKQNLHLVTNNLGPKTSWARRNVIWKQSQKCMELSSYQQHRNNDQQLAASPWFQEGLSRYHIYSEIQAMCK